MQLDRMHFDWKPVDDTDLHSSVSQIATNDAPSHPYKG